MKINATMISVVLDDSKKDDIKTVLKCYDNESSNFDRYDLKIKGDVTKKYEISKNYDLKVRPSIFNGKLYLSLDIL